MKIGDFDLAKQVLIVAEIGNNHEGDFERAKDLIDAAKESGASAVKFQTIRAEQLVSVADQKRLEQLKRFELTREQFEALSEWASKCGMMFLSTPFDLDVAQFLNQLVPAFKIASGDNTFYPLLEKVARFGKPVILSCGMLPLSEITYAKALIEKNQIEVGARPAVILLHCVSCYPTAPEEANLLAIQHLRQHFNCLVGYSDHTLGIEAAVSSIALGACVIEKHFTLDKNQSSFRDHQLSSDPAEFTSLVQRLRLLEKLLGDGRKERRGREQSGEENLRRSIAAARDLSAGSIIQWSDLSWVRPGGHLAPGKECLVIGKKVRRTLKKGDFLAEDSLE